MCRMLYLDFRYLGTSKSGKTKIYSIRSSVNPDCKLGIIKWFSNWRKYCFFTEGFDSIFDDKCLNQLNDFIKELNTEHKIMKNKDAIKRKKDGNPHAQCY